MLEFFTVEGKNDYSHLLSMTQYNKGYDQSVVAGRGIQKGDTDKIIFIFQQVHLKICL